MTRKKSDSAPVRWAKLSKNRITGRSKSSKHNPKLKKSLKRKGTRLVHGYETTRRKKR